MRYKIHDPGYKKRAPAVLREILDPEAWIVEPFRDTTITCPTCGESIVLRIDMTEGRHQSFVLDCEVCCRPIAVRVELSGDSILDVRAESES